MCQMQQGSESQEDLHEICLHIAEQCPSERENVPNGPAAERKTYQEGNRELALHWSITEYNRKTEF